ncbi:BlaI/MecI/CopY family transcriptional regulator [Blautia schinkii]|nr:BlaI/MecI/CopY family transcriptional regulator [Blautia schinkii]
MEIKYSGGEVVKSLSSRQFEIMNILWESDEPMVASQILAMDKNLNINTVQSVLRSLSKKKFIELADIVYSGTVLARSYRPVISKGEYLQSLCNESSGSNSALAALVNQEKDIKVLEELEKLIADAKERLKS